MMDEQLIDEVAQHAVIYNRQKYYLNGSNGPGGGNKYETKDEAWHVIAMKLRSDVETCKKRWKYLRERYVSQRKQGDPPVYEHLSRPYLEKMKFLDQHIQPRKSYRNVPNFLTSPHSANGSAFTDYNMDSKSNSSMKNISHFGTHHHFHPQHDQQHSINPLNTTNTVTSSLENESRVKIEADQVFRDFAAAVASQQLQSQMHQQAAAVAAAMADSSHNYPEQFRETTANSLVTAQSTQNITMNGGLPSSSSSLKSPMSSPMTSVSHNGTNSGSSNTAQQINSHSACNVGHSNSTNQISVNHHFNASTCDDIDSSGGSNYNMKKPRVQLNSNNANTSNPHENDNSDPSQNIQNNSNYIEDTDDDSDDNSNIVQPSNNDTTENPFNTLTASTSTPNLQRQNINGINQHNQSTNMFSSNTDFLFQLYQQLPHQQRQQTNVQPNHQFNKFQVPQTSPPQRSSEHLLGELVTTELLKMSKERRKCVQKRILEILFFDD